MSVAKALSFQNLTVRVDKTPLLNDVSLDIPATGLTGIVGANGAGKSTLVKAAIGLIKPSSGAVHVLDRALPAWSLKALAQSVGYVPQHVHSHWELTVRELLALGQARPTPALIDEFELDPLIDRRFNTLSGGEQARAAVARALAHDPDLLLADEPVAHLDLPHQHRLMRLMQRQAKTRAVVIVLHDLHLAATYCDQVALLAHGRLVAHGSPLEVLTETRLASAYGHAMRRIAVSDGTFFTTA